MASHKNQKSPIDFAADIMIKVTPSCTSCHHVASRHVCILETSYSRCCCHQRVLCMINSNNNSLSRHCNLARIDRRQQCAERMNKTTTMAAATTTTATTYCRQSDRRSEELLSYCVERQTREQSAHTTLHNTHKVAEISWVTHPQVTATVCPSLLRSALKHVY